MLPLLAAAAPALLNAVKGAAKVAAITKSGNKPGQGGGAGALGAPGGSGGQAQAALSEGAKASADAARNAAETVWSHGQRQVQLAAAHPLDEYLQDIGG